MAANNRIFYACQLVGLANHGTAAADGAHTVAHGVQSVGITTNFNLEQAFELGQIQIYENIEGLPDVEVTMEKVLDGYPLLYHLASPSPESVGLVGRGKSRCDLSLGIFSDAFDSVTDSTNSGEAPVEVYCSGMYLGSISYTIPVDGNCTESITLQGNDKQWITSDTDKHLSSASTAFGKSSSSLTQTPDSPLALQQLGSGGVQRRENVLLAKSIFPVGVYGAGAMSTNGGSGNIWNASTASPTVHVQNISISTDFSREDILELGRKSPYFRAPGFPIEVTCDIEAIAISGDFIGAYEVGDPSLFGTTSSGDNTSEETIQIHLLDSTVFDLGQSNRLSSVSYGGGDATGGNVSISYSYTNFNELDVLHMQDPARASKYTAYQKALTHRS